MACEENDTTHGEEVDAKKIADDMARWDGPPAYRDDVADIVANMENEGETS